MTLTMTYTEELVVTSCWCGIKLAVPTDLHNYAKRHKNKAIFCPLGHEFIYSNTTEEQLRKERDRAARLQAELDQTEASLRAQKSATKRFQNKVKRVEAGVCPHCRRNFTNLRRHMESKHQHADAA